MKYVNLLVFLGFLLMTGAVDVQAECARMVETTAERFARTPLVFFGEVLKVETVTLDPEPYVNRVRFRVDHAYKGTSTGEQTFDFGETAEDFIFKEGQHVLVYAHRDQRGKFSTQCSATRNTTPEDPDLTDLGKLSGR